MYKIFEDMLSLLSHFKIDKNKFKQFVKVMQCNLSRSPHSLTNIRFYFFVFWQTVRSKYRDNPYHNWIHAVDIVQTLYVMLVLYPFFSLPLFRPIRFSTTVKPTLLTSSLPRPPGTILSSGATFTTHTSRLNCSEHNRSY